MNRIIRACAQKKRYIFTIILLIWGGVILFLSFQNGTETASTSQHVTLLVLKILGVDTNDWNLVMLWDHRLRVAAHVATFFLYGMLGAFALDSDFAMKKVWRMLFVISGIGLAIWSEAGKVQMGIPGRHCDGKEMLLNLIGFAVGFLLNVGLCHLVKRRYRHLDR